jgi:hypothetical protein
MKNVVGRELLRSEGVGQIAPLAPHPLLGGPADKVRPHWLRVTSLNLNSVNQLIFVMVKCGVLFEVRTGFLNNI